MALYIVPRHREMRSLLQMLLLQQTMMYLIFYYDIVCTVQKETANSYDATHVKIRLILKPV